MADQERGDDSKSTKVKEECNKSNDDGRNGTISVLNVDTQKICSPDGFLGVPRLQPIEQVPKTVLLRSSSLLRPSQLNGNPSSTLTSLKHNFLLNPSKLYPFEKTPSETKELESETVNISTTTPKFLPLIQNGNKTEVLKTTTSTASTSTISQTSNFIFGQNIHDRVVSNQHSDDKKCNATENSNGTCDMLFSTVLKENSNNLTPDSASPVSQVTKSLSESAREYEESRAVKRKFEEVEVITGEEGERNVLQITCKLFAFDKSTGGSWQERGRGTLRLNDQDTVDGTQSRLVFRASGSLRVVLNTKIWAEMTIELASNKSIRFMAFDANGEVKVFLLTGNQEDVKLLFKLLETRLQKEINRQKCSKTKAAETSTEASNVENVNAD
ncbi:hypothetical protein FQA39_LY00899 [Lamprigera yunnana]|nr:hypothetical protein FQA39_LY00899 [Lamprigera yunnana]